MILMAFIRTMNNNLSYGVLKKKISSLSNKLKIFQKKRN